MNHNWVYKTLGETCIVIGGSTPKTDVPEYWCGKHNWFTPAELDSKKYYAESERKITDAAIKASGLTLMPKGTVLLTSRAPIGKIGITTEDSFCNQGFKCLVCKDELYNEYLYYTLQYFNSEIQDKGRGATFKEISKKVTESISIPVPPMPIQKRIATELDGINAMIAGRKEQLRELDLLAQSIFYDMFGDPISNPKGWEMCDISEVANIKIGPFGSLLHKEDYVSGGTPLINPVHMQNGYVRVDNNFTISDDKKADLTNYLLATNDIIFGRRGDIGRCALITASEDGFLCGTGSLFLRFFIEINPIYSLWVLKSPCISKFLLNKASGATMLNINCGIIASVPLILPPLSLQDQFASKIEAIENQKRETEASIRELQTLLDSRMDYWFN